LGKTVFRTKKWKAGHRDDVLKYTDKIYKSEFEKLNIENFVSDKVKAVIEQMVKSFWDVFAKDWLKRTMLGFEFSIDT